MHTPKAHKKQLASSSESNQRVYDFLKSHPVGVLAMVDPNGNPHATVIYFSIEEDFSISFTTKRDTKKHDNLQHNNHVMLVAYEAETQTTTQVIGTAEDITDAQQAQETFTNTQIAASETSEEAGEPPISKLYAGEYVAYSLKPAQIRMAVFARPDSGGYDMYETIDFAS
jgi:general stress protein 26